MASLYQPQNGGVVGTAMLQGHGQQWGAPQKCTTCQPREQLSWTAQKNPWNNDPGMAHTLQAESTHRALAANPIWVVPQILAGGERAGVPRSGLYSTSHTLGCWNRSSWL